MELARVIERTLPKPHPNPTCNLPGYLENLPRRSTGSIYICWLTFLRRALRQALLVRRALPMPASLAACGPFRATAAEREASPRPACTFRDSPTAHPLGPLAH